MKVIALCLFAASLGWGQAQPTKKYVPHYEYLLPDGSEQEGCKLPAKSKPEPLDVPAIKTAKSTLHPVAAGKAQCPAGYEADWNYNREICPAGNSCSAVLTCYPSRQSWTCAESRILLTDESGGKHCIKFPKEGGN